MVSLLEKLLIFNIIEQKWTNMIVGSFYIFSKEQEKLIFVNLFSIFSFAW